MHFNLVEIYRHMGVFALGIAWTLVAMAVATLAVFLERNMAFLRHKAASRRFAPRAARLLDAQQHEHVVAEADKARASFLARLLGQGVRSYLAQRTRPAGRLGTVELTRRELVRIHERLTVDVRRGLSLLATVGSVAPFVGLLGTVVGIIEAFTGIAKEGSGGLGAVSGGIAEALVVTAFGLLVAIPAVFAYNFLTTRSDAILLQLDQARAELVDHLENTHGVDLRAHLSNGAAVATGVEQPARAPNGESHGRRS